MSRGKTSQIGPKLDKEVSVRTSTDGQIRRFNAISRCLTLTIDASKRGFYRSFLASI